ncbi:hypothetical protein WR25_17101 [Diploscapter pachys]|uniref:Uncharacterized protein n=1 Tax=Diploscapter pachys TaxID=2018661 RepID=A0A2A2J9R2_9BILA|nr:hypothetical protein WR25_17101 [Diploscapter pachys]
MYKYLVLLIVAMFAASAMAGYGAPQPPSYGYSGGQGSFGGAPFSGGGGSFGGFNQGGGFSQGGFGRK